MQGDELKEIREGLSLSQADFAEQLGMSRVMIGLMERGEKPIERRTQLAALYLAHHPASAWPGVEPAFHTRSVADRLRLFLSRRGRPSTEG